MPQSDNTTIVVPCNKSRLATVNPVWVALPLLVVPWPHTCYTFCCKVPTTWHSACLVHLLFNFSQQNSVYCTHQKDRHLYAQLFQNHKFQWQGQYASFFNRMCDDHSSEWNHQMFITTNIYWIDPWAEKLNTLLDKYLLHKYLLTRGKSPSSNLLHFTWVTKPTWTLVQQSMMIWRDIAMALCLLLGFISTSGSRNPLFNPNRTDHCVPLLPKTIIWFQC